MPARQSFFLCHLGRLLDDEDCEARHASRSGGEQEPQGPGSEPNVVIDTTKGHRDDEKHNIREQAAHGNLTQNTSNRRSG
jgi:hypothetical protein